MVVLMLVLLFARDGRKPGVRLLLPSLAQESLTRALCFTPGRLSPTPPAAVNHVTTVSCSTGEGRIAQMPELRMQSVLRRSEQQVRSVAVFRSPRPEFLSSHIPCVRGAVAHTSRAGSLSWVAEPVSCKVMPVDPRRGFCGLCPQSRLSRPTSCVVFCKVVRIASGLTVATPEIRMMKETSAYFVDWTVKLENECPSHRPGQESYRIPFPRTSCRGRSR